MNAFLEHNQSDVSTGASALTGQTEILAVSLHASGPEDDAFLSRVYASTRSDEMELTGWDYAQRASFLEMQYQTQKRFYGMQFPDAQQWIIHWNDTAVGRIILHRSNEEILLVDLALLPEHRQRKIGSLLMAAVMEEARQSNKIVRLHVERLNPALQWYGRLGFKMLAAGEIYCEMLWQGGDPTHD